MSVVVTTTYPQPGMALATWASLATVETGDRISVSRWADKTVQVSGTTGVGGTVTIEGSNDGTTYATLSDPQGTALSGLTASIELIQENPTYIRAKVLSGDGTTALKVTILGRDGS